MYLSVTFPYSPLFGWSIYYPIYTMEMGFYHTHDLILIHLALILHSNVYGRTRQLDSVDQ